VIGLDPVTAAGLERRALLPHLLDRPRSKSKSGPLSGSKSGSKPSSMATAIPIPISSSIPI